VTRILDGKAAAEAVREEVVRRIAALAERRVVPGLALVRVGDDPASESYVRSKNRMSGKVGIRSEVHALDAGVGPERLAALIRELNARADIHGILLQLPLPGGYEADRFLAMIEPGKDVDGFHPVNVGRVAQGLDGFVPCTPLGIQRLLVENDVPIPGRRVVILGRSILVGRPLATLLSQKGPHADATVTLCHSRSRDLPSISREADILVAAMGRRHFVTAEMVREGAVVVDVGIHRVEGGDGAAAITGDVDFERVAPKTSAITPVPGGVGPMTVAMLLWNTTRAAERLCS
jgi:methylenetetrahydrofolate dehydrogenase (NADP+)/methenyltetrahydrofolate cyclohydrolase